MRTVNGVHLEPGDRAEVIEHNGSTWLEMVSPGEHDGFPIHARTAEQFEALADAADECARRMRERAARQFDLGAHLEKSA